MANRTFVLNEEQKDAARAIFNYPITVLHGPAGTGKTGTAIHVGMKMLKDKLVDQIVLTRPAVSTEDYGFLPGEIADKFEGPYLAPLGQAVTAEVPSVVQAISESEVAERTVEGMKHTLNRLSSLSEQYNQPAVELFGRLNSMGISMETIVEMYAAIKQAYVTTIYIVENTQDTAASVTNLFSLNLSNALFFRKFNYIPEEIMPEVVIAVTNIMFQLETGEDDTGDSTE